MPPKPEFESLVDAYAPEIHAYLWRMMRSPQDAEDCLQETFLRAQRAYPRLRDYAQLRAWLYKIATNTARTHLGRRGRLAQRTGDLDPKLAAADPSPAEWVIRRQELAEVLALIEALPAKQRAALMMRKYQGLGYAAIGAALECSPAAARADVYQALRKLRTQLDERDTPAGVRA